MKISEYIAGCLSRHGVRYVFGLPGGPSIPFMEALKAAGIEFFLTSNESAAGIMADVSARITGIPGICHATFGPGATNITTGIGGALLDRSPVIVFTSEMNDAMINRTTQMNIDHQKLFGPVTKATFRLSRENYPEVIESAFGICQDGYPGPVHIGLPSDICSFEADQQAIRIYQSKNAIFNNNPRRIINMLKIARRPVLALGLTAARLISKKQIMSFLEDFPIPVVITPMAKGLIPESHPCYAGVLFHSLSDYLEDIWNDCDLVIGLGYDPVEFNYESWLPGAPLIHFDTKETDMPQDHSSETYIGPPEEWFSIMRNLERNSLRPGLESVRDTQAEMLSVFNGFTSHFGPSAALRILMEELPGDTILTADVGSHLHLIGQFWKTGGLGKIIMTNGWSGMGFGLPAAIAARLMRRNQPVVCITGDGGFLMNAGEMITARRYNLPVIIVVFSDGELNLIKVKQTWQNIAPYSTMLYQGDLFGSDTFLGCRVLPASNHSDMRKAITAALVINQPVIINAIIDPEEYKWLIVRR